MVRKRPSAWGVMSLPSRYEPSVSMKKLQCTSSRPSSSVLVVAPSRKRAFASQRCPTSWARTVSVLSSPRKRWLMSSGYFPIVSMVMKLSRRPRLPYSAAEVGLAGPDPGVRVVDGLLEREGPGGDEPARRVDDELLVVVRVGGVELARHRHRVEAVAVAEALRERARARHRRRVREVHGGDAARPVAGGDPGGRLLDGRGQLGVVDEIDAAVRPERDLERVLVGLVELRHRAPGDGRVVRHGQERDRATRFRVQVHEQGRDARRTVDEPAHVTAGRGVVLLAEGDVPVGVHEGGAVGLTEEREAERQRDRASSRRRRG